MTQAPTLPEVKLPTFYPEDLVPALKLYVEVAVDSTTPTLESLTYAVPEELAQIIEAGQLVWVPLKKGRVQGLVLAVGATKPPFVTRNLIDIVDPRPVLLPHQLDLARWLSEYYCAGLYESASLMLPAGLSRSAKPTLALTPAAESGLLPSDLGRNDYFLVELLRDYQSNQPDPTETSEILLIEAKSSYIAKRPKSGFERAVNALEEAGLVRRGFLLPRPSIKPKLLPYLRISPLLTEHLSFEAPVEATPPEEVAADKPKRKAAKAKAFLKFESPDGEVYLTEDNLVKKLKNAPRQIAVIEYLLREAEPGFLLPASEVAEDSETTLGVLRAMAEKGLVEMEEREVRRDPLANRPQREKAEEAPLLTYRQSLVWRQILDGLQQPEPQTFLLHGVTGSGKTELYLRAIARTLRDGKQAIVLVPEIALTAQTVDRFAARFPGKVAVRHSKLSPGEAYDEWRRAREGEAAIVIGARSAIFAPLSRLGLIIIDEEHEASYKQDDSQWKSQTLYHAREVALQLAQLTGAKVILGSATPAVESYFRAQAGEFKLLELPERVAAPSDSEQTSQSHPVGSLPLPPIQIVDLRQELKAGNSSIFSRDLRRQLKETLENKHQAILFLNRRGTSTVVMCRDCGHVQQCEDCETPLVWHADLEKLLCHRCGRRYNHPERCPNCNSLRIRYFGTGTKKVEEEVLKLFPQARVLRWDQDTIAEGGRDSYQTLYDKMARHEADILVGTQMIAKGLDLPMVSLVGVVTADTGLHLPDFRATERTFQILTQVAGRAGRRTGSSATARAILQTYTPDQYAIEAASRHNYRAFYMHELEFRSNRLYPPFCKLIRFVYAYPKEQRAKFELERLAEEFRLQFEEARIDPNSWSMIGPAPSFQRKFRNLYRYQFILRIHRPESHPQDRDEQVIRRIVARLRPQLVHGWTIDVDPQSLL